MPRSDPSPPITTTMNAKISERRAALRVDGAEVDAARARRRVAAATPPIAKTSVNARRTSIPSAVTIARFSTPARMISP